MAAVSSSSSSHDLMAWVVCSIMGLERRSKTTSDRAGGKWYKSVCVTVLSPPSSPTQDAVILLQRLPPPHITATTCDHPDYTLQVGNSSSSNSNGVLITIRPSPHWHWLKWMRDELVEQATTAY